MRGREEVLREEGVWEFGFDWREENENDEDELEDLAISVVGVNALAPMRQSCL